MQEKLKKIGCCFRTTFHPSLYDVCLQYQYFLLGLLPRFLPIIFRHLYNIVGIILKWHLNFSMSSSVSFLIVLRNWFLHRNSLVSLIWARYPILLKVPNKSFFYKLKSILNGFQFSPIALLHHSVELEQKNSILRRTYLQTSVLHLKDCSLSI